MNKKHRIIIPAVVVVVAVVVWLIVFNNSRDDSVLYASGTVEATEARLGFPTPGRLDSVFVREGDAVTAGVELAALDRTEAAARLQQARAQAAAAQALLEELQSGTRVEELARARAARKAAGEQLNDIQRDFSRGQELYAGGAISKEALDKMNTALEVAQSRDTEAAEYLRQLQSGPRVERIAAQHAALEQAEAQAAAAAAVVSNMTIRAPFDGTITVRHFEPGEIVPAGSAVLTIQDHNDRWVRIYVPENKIGALRLGSPVKITTDSYADKSYSGEVRFIAAEAEFTPKTVQTAEERVRLVYLVKVRITADPSFDLKAGMPADVQLELAE